MRVHGEASIVAVPQRAVVLGQFMALVEAHGHGVAQNYSCCGRRLPINFSLCYSLDNFF